MRDFEGKVAVVTGAASGIGLGLATRFAQEGMKACMPAWSRRLSTPPLPGCEPLGRDQRHSGLPAHHARPGRRGARRQHCLDSGRHDKHVRHLRCDQARRGRPLGVPLPQPAREQREGRRLRPLPQLRHDQPQHIRPQPPFGAAERDARGIGASVLGLRPLHPQRPPEADRTGRGRRHRAQGHTGEPLLDFTDQEMHETIRARVDAKLEGRNPGRTLL
jgi:NAD(P)-dependent dehydrogenase (short-subunit alcohol dehydrogenase family)